MAGRPKADTAKAEVRKPAGRTKSPGRPKSPDRQSATRKSPTRTKSPARTKSPGRPKSTTTTTASSVKTQEVKPRPATPTRLSTRTKSPSRPRAESPKRISARSPSRRSPIRRSPGRYKEITVELEIAKEKAYRVSSQPQISLDSESDTEPEEKIVEVKEKPKAAVRGRTRLIDTEYEREHEFTKEPSTEIKELSSFGLTRRSTRLTQQNSSVTTSKVYHLKQFDPVTVSKRVGEFSDEDDTQEKEAIKDFDYSGQKKYKEFGGSIGAGINMVLLPLSAVALYMVCDETQCSLTKLPNWKKYKSISTFWDNLSVLVTISFMLVLTILSAAPFVGRKVPEMPNKHSKYVYIMNGLFSLGVALVTVCGLEFWEIPIADFIVNHIFHLLIGSILLSAIISVMLYFRSFYVPVSALNTHVAGKSSIYGFFMGRELNPRIFGNVDLKIILFRAFLIQGVLIDFAYTYKSLGVNIHHLNDSSRAITLNPTIVVFVVLHTIYLLDPLIFESTWTTTFTQQQEGLGYQLVMIFSTASFFHAAVIRYLYEHEVELETWKLVLAGIIFAFGYILSRGSDNQKNAFRRNPYGPSFSNLESIPTSTGKKLLASGFWGVVRHPNYLGSIHCNLSWAIFCWSAPPVLGVVLAILGLIGRTYRMESRCKLKYGAAWERYCAKVKYALIPKIY